MDKKNLKFEYRSGDHKLAIIRVRGQTGLKKDIKDTLKMLKVFRNNYCVVYNATPSIMGMIKKAKDFITYGEIDEETYKLLVEKRGEEYKGRLEDTKKKINYSSKYFEFGGKKYNKHFRLSPPRKGWERKGIKTPLTLGGALGYRGKEINQLIKRMI